MVICCLVRLDDISFGLCLVYELQSKYSHPYDSAQHCLGTVYVNMHQLESSLKGDRLPAADENNLLKIVRKTVMKPNMVGRVFWPRWFKVEMYRTVILVCLVQIQMILHTCSH